MIDNQLLLNINVYLSSLVTLPWDKESGVGYLILGDQLNYKQNVIGTRWFFFNVGRESLTFERLWS